MEVIKYIVWFSNSNYPPEGVTVKAQNQACALILAQAGRILEDLDYTLHHIEEIK